jgi:hypothetical protein
MAHAILPASVVWVVLGSACSHAPPPPALPPPPPAIPSAEPLPPPSNEPAPRPLLSIDWKTVKVTDDATALALWEKIAPTGADWELRIGELPDDDGLQRHLAFALLRGGNFACQMPSAAPSCAGGDATVSATVNATFNATLAAAPEATFSDPCLRRELALWALDRLDDEDAPSLERDLLALVALPPPEDELVREAFDLVPVGADELLLHMIEAAHGAGQGDIADESLGWLPRPMLLQIATKLHSDAALLALDPAEARPAFIAAITDGKLKPATSIAALDDLISADDSKLKKDVRAALLAALKDPRCEVAAAAAAALVTSGELRYLPRPALTSIPASLRALCVMASYSQEEAGLDSGLRRFISKRGLQIYDHADLTAPLDEIGGEVILPAELIVLPFLEELSAALEHCTTTPVPGRVAAPGPNAVPSSGTICRGQSLLFLLSFDPDRTLRRIDRFAEPSVCPE